MSENIQTYDIDSERIALKALIQKPNFAKQVILYNLLFDDHFVDLFHKDILNVFYKFYRKFGQSPTSKQLKHYLPKYMTYVDKFKTKQHQMKIWLGAVERLYNDMSENEIKNIDASVSILDELRKARVIQRVIIKSTKSFETGNYDRVIENFSEAIIDSRKVENMITEGNIVDDLDYHIQLDKRIKSGEDRPISTHIFGIFEDQKTKKIKKADLDSLLTGGFYPGEVVLFVGEVNIGKSFTLMETAYCTSRFEKKNSILYTIEMNKTKCQRRIYSRATGIPYRKFKMGELTKDDKEKLYRWKEDWKKNCGILEVVSFDKGATVGDIENKTKDIENKYGEEFELTAIDYLNDLKPMGRFQNSKSWDAIGEISWDLANFSKFHHNHKGISTITAVQKKTIMYGKSETKAGSGAMSALPEHHATVAIGLGQNDEDKFYGLNGRIRYDIFKSRDDKKDISFYTFPNFKVSRIHSEKSMRYHYQDQLEELKNEESRGNE